MRYPLLPSWGFHFLDHPRVRDGVYHSSKVIFMRLEAAGADRGFEFSFDSGKVVSWRPVPVPWLDVFLLLELCFFLGCGDLDLTFFRTCGS